MQCMRTAPPINLSPETRQQFLRHSRGRRMPKRLVERAKIVLMAAYGRQNQVIAVALGLSRLTV